MCRHGRQCAGSHPAGVTVAAICSGTLKKHLKVVRKRKMRKREPPRYEPKSLLSVRLEMLADMA